MGFLGQEYWSGLPCPPPGDLPHPGIEPMSPVFPGLAGGFFTIEPPWKLIPWEVDLNALSLFLLVSSPVQQGSSERGSEEGRRVRSAHLLSFYSHRTVNRLHPSTRGPSSHQAALCTELFPGSRTAFLSLPQKPVCGNGITKLLIPGYFINTFGFLKSCPHFCRVPLLNSPQITNFAQI